MNKTKFFSSLLVAALFASTSVFTSCKDYDDDIKHLQEQIDVRAMQADLESLKSSLTSQLETVKQTLNTKDAELEKAIQQLQSDLSTKANASDLNALNSKVELQAAAIEKLVSSIDALTAKDAALQTQIDAINAALDEYAKKKDLEELAAKYTALKGDFDKAVEELTAKIGAVEATAKANDIAIAAVQENLQKQQEAFDAYKSAMDKRLAEMEEQLKALHAVDVTALQNSINGINGEIEKINKKINDNYAELTKKINDVDAKLANYYTKAEADKNLEDLKKELKADMTKLSEAINDVQDQVNVINAFIDKQLTSLVLLPDFYWEGLEAIESPALYANLYGVNTQPYTFTYTVTGGTLGDRTLDVTVKETMAFKATDGKIYTSESAFTWLDREAEYENYTYIDGGSLTYQDAVNMIVRNSSDPDAKPTTETLNHGAEAIYHYNPSTADLNGWKINFFANAAAHYTRSIFDVNSILGATPWDDEMGNNYFKNGVLAVPFDVNWDAVYGLYMNWAYNNYTAESDGDGYRHMSPDWDDWNGYYGYHAHGTSLDENYEKGEAYLPFIAMQLQKGDTTVTSDYAVVVPAELTIVALADNKPEKIIGGRDTKFSGEHAYKNYGDVYEYYGEVRANHLYESVGYNGCSDTDGYGAIPMPATHSVQYDGKIDLKPFIETHYNYTSYAKYGQSSLDKVMDDQTMAMLQLHYEFKAIDYMVGNEKTSESAHIEYLGDGVFAPRSVDENGNTIKGKTATREVIDREPLVRVDLVDAEGNIVRYGYIKLRIVEAEQAKEDMEVEFDFGDIFMNCGDSVRLTWSQMENKILAKLGTNGLTKQEFEKAYYMENVGGHEYMPHITPAAGEVPGGLYTDAQASKFMATRYYKKDGKYVAVDGDDNLKNMSKYTNTANWFGRVWYTPHDNATTGQNWDSQTNVLIWNICEGYAGNMNTQAAYETMIKAVDASYDSKGLSEKELSTVVRFVNKFTGASIWVTLKFDAKKVHFAYGDINHRVLDHWYDYKEGYKDYVNVGEENDTIEVYASVPTPQEVQQETKLGFYSFYKDLKEYWLKKEVLPTIYSHEYEDKDGNKKTYNFTKFTAKDNLSVTFQFRLPKKGENTVDLDAKSGQWTVYGISGTKYTLYLDNNKRIIWAKKTGTMTADEKICEISSDGHVTYYGRAYETQYSAGIVNYDAETDVADVVNGAATDILNLIGMYDAKGNKQRNIYLTGHDKKTFAAYVEIKVASEACYTPLIGKNFFNVRFLRPINVWAGNVEVTDALNATQFIDIWKLLYIRDWRTYAVVPKDLKQKFGSKNIDGTGFDGKEHKGDFAEGNITYEYYNISNLYVRRNEIRSDAYLEPSKRVALDPVNDVDKIKALYSVEDIPALTNGGLQYLKIIPKSAANAASYTVATTPGKIASTSFDDVLAYSNNGGVVNEFHIYVPIAVEYPWGALRIYTQTVWAVVTINPTIN